MCLKYRNTKGEGTFLSRSGHGHVHVGGMPCLSLGSARNRLRQDLSIISSSLEGDSKKGQWGREE